MSKLLTEYFKVVENPETMQNTPKRKLSLIKKATPPKILKIDHSRVCIIDLGSDDEEMSTKLDSLCKEKINHCNGNMDSIPNENKHDETCSSSASTIIYTPGTPRKTQTPKSSHSKSPGSHTKFFSPVKKRIVTIKSPSKVKRNLCDMLNTNKNEDSLFLRACAGMDDKTVFLLSIINKYLDNNELRPLLLKDSQDLLSKCMVTKKPGMKLVCRLYWRKVGWYRVYEIKKISTEKGKAVDNSNIEDMINNLIKNDILECGNCDASKCDMGFEDFLAVLKLEELKSVCKDLKLKVKNKQEAIESLRSYGRQKSNISTYFIGPKSDNDVRALKLLAAKTGPCYRLTGVTRRTLDELYRLMYLGMDYNVIREKKLEFMLINDKIKRECYPEIDGLVDDASVVFKNRDDFERYMNAVNIYEDYLAETDVKKKCADVENVYSLYKSIDNTAMSSYEAMPPWLQRFTPPYLYVKILEAGLQELKKLKSERYIALALDISSQLIAQSTFRQHKKAEWYAEKALILDKFTCSAEQAAKVLLEGFSSDLSEVCKDWLRPRALKIAKRLAHGVCAATRGALLLHAAKEQIMEKNLNAKHIYKIPMDLNKSRGKIKFETRTAEGTVVQEAEEFCIDHYIAEGKYTHGGHWEGKIVSTIFFLLFWDIIYSRPTGARGVFLTHYQAFPLDLYLDSFYTNRKELIEERLREIEESPVEAALNRMEATWNSRPETELSGISRHIGWQAVRAVAAGLRARRLAALCRRAAHYGYAHSGFPDLTLWNEYTREVKFVEVKTDSDKPSLKQIQWMHYLQENSIDTEFCYVGVNTTRCKARNS